jgi:hypothetical protein
MPALADDLELLKHPRSPKRRTEAKRLRKRGDILAGPSLLSALQKEVEDSRTWETQYQLVMALGECLYVDAVPFLKDFSVRQLKATMIYVGLGDALVRLQIQSLEDGAPILELMRQQNEMLTDGAFRAMAMLKMVPRENQIDQILRVVSALPLDHYNRFWPLAAAPGWKGDNVVAFIAECTRSPRSDIQEAAKLAADQKYKKWNPA